MQILYETLPLLHFINGFITFLIIIYTTWNSIRMGLMISHYLGIISFATQFHMKTIAESLQKALRILNHRSIGVFGNLLFVDKLYFVIWQHSDMTLKARHINRNLASDSLMASMVTNFGVNIWMITMLVYGNLDSWQTILFLVLTSLQILIVYNVSYLFIKWADSLRSTKQLLFPAQLCLNQSFILAKLKLMTHYEMINNKKAFKFQIGILGNISKRAILKVSNVFSILKMLICFIFNFSFLCVTVDIYCLLLLLLKIFPCLKSNIHLDLN